MVHRGSHDDLSDHELSDNDSHSAEDRYFIVTYGKASGSSGRKSRIRTFLRPASYSDDEPLMENKSVSISQLDDVAGRVQFCNNQDVASSTGNKYSGLTSSTSSSVLVESQDPSHDKRLTVTTATYSTLAEPQSTRRDVNTATVVKTSSSPGLLVTQENGNVWELTVPQATCIRPRSPSPVHRRASYLMATEGDGSLEARNWEFDSLADCATKVDILSPVDEEHNIFQVFSLLFDFSSTFEVCQKSVM